jgi:beta-mannosidase
MKRIDLNFWNLKKELNSLNLEIKTPETVFEALLKNKIIDNPFYGLNEKNIPWIYESNWLYKIEFRLNASFLKHSNIILQFNGLDTIADIYLNGVLLDSTNNMFKTYSYQVKPKLITKLNKIVILFKSPINYTKKLIKKFGIKLNTGEENRALPGIPYLRKAQYSFGWDWGPILPDMGIWKSVKLIGYDKIRIKSVFPIQNIKFKDLNIMLNQGNFLLPRAESVLIKCQVEIDSSVDDLGKLNYKINIQINSKEGKTFTNEIKLKKKEQIIELTIPEPHLWWTHDLGEPYLYDLSVSIINYGIIDQVKQKLGVREIKLIRNPDEWGQTFYFILNKVPIFAKGANWIPIDSFIPRGKKKGLYQRNLKDAKLANMNMIRIWGGGIYEDNEFYNICDKLGILVWQDFPFACAIYPIQEEFYENVKEEFIQNIKRLRFHPSLAIWCGNNEIEYLWRYLKESSEITDKKNELKYKKGYVRLFEKMLPNLLKKLDPTRPYWPSSPSNGFCGLSIGSVYSNSPSKGDSHYWSVWHAGKPFKAYRSFNSRFMSEFGFESFPSMKTIESFCPKEQFDMFSPIIENHQKNDAGNQKILDYMKKRFLIPAKFEKQIILSQITQAEAIEYGVEHWRKNRKDFRCMGSLYWQLNDCWPVASWSSVDYYGRWKALHYFAKRFYSNLFPYVEEKKNQVKFGVVNDTPHSEDLIFIWKIMNSNGNILLEGKEISKVNGLESKELTTVDVSEINKTKKMRQNNIIFYKLQKASTKKIIYRGSRLFENPKDFNLKDPEISYTIDTLKSNLGNLKKLKIQIKTKRICLYTYIISDLIDFIASDNFFSLEPLETREIIIKTKKKPNEKSISLGKILDSFSIGSLYDLIYS